MSLYYFKRKKYFMKYEIIDMCEFFSIVFLMFFDNEDFRKNGFH